MQPQVDQNIIELLKQSSNQGLTFYQAKQALLLKGYEAGAIELAADHFEYGPKPTQLEPATAVFETDPSDTALVAQEILKDQKEPREEQAIADGLAGHFSPDLQSDVKYQNNFLHDIGMSWWTWIVIEVIISGAIYWLGLPSYTYGIVAVVLVIVFSIKRA